MIKRFRFGVSTASQPATGSARPLRTTRSTPLDEYLSSYSFITDWFDDRESLAQYEACETNQTALGTIVVAEEFVQRGGDWLERRWVSRGTQWKHVALAKRTHGLSQLEFSQSWRGHAGKATTKTAATVAIPSAARGLAYVQNHPLLDCEWLYDAITEVWFDSPESMLPRVDWFRDNVTTDDLFGKTNFVAVAEEVLSG